MSMETPVSGVESGPSVMGDCGCDGDRSGLVAALGPSFETLFEDGYSEQYEHATEAIYRTHDGRLVFACCAACSCAGSGDWAYYDTLEQARARVSPWRRPKEWA